MRIAVTLAITGLALAGCAQSPDGGPSGAEVELHAVSFQPGAVTVAVGDGVTFRVVEASHTVDFTEGEAGVSGIDRAHSGNLDPGDTFVVTFGERGTYPYFCLYHSSVSGGERVGMVGTITVE
jgi:plastocyanin